MRRVVEEDARKVRPRWRRPVLIVLAVVLGLALVVVGFYAWRIDRTLRDIERRPLITNRAEQPVEDPGLNYVLMGTDSRVSGERGRSDALIWAHVPPSRDKVYLINFPRDMWVDVPGHGMAKINAAYSWGGAPLVIKTLEQLTGIQPDHIVQVDFEGFVNLTNQLGGVEVFNRVESRLGGYEFPKGYIHIQGDEALNYVRQRYELPNGDLDRAERQRATTMAILMKIASREVVTDPVRFNAVMDQLGKNFVVDDKLTNATIYSTALSMKIRYSDDIRLLQAPISGFERSEDGQLTVTVNHEQLAEMATAIKQNRMEEYWRKYLRQPYTGTKR